MRSANPFAPTFGALPPVLAGRADVIGDIAAAWETGPTHPGYTALLLGRRGTGKTVVLEELRTLAQRRGWLTVSAAAVTPGLLDRLSHAAAEHLNRAAEALDADLRGDLAAAGIGIAAAYDPGADLARRLGTVLSVLARHLDRQGAGMVVTVDELHAGHADELRTLGIALQDVTRLAQLPMAFVGAGLPVLEDTLLSDESVTFLQRCGRYEVGFLDHAAARTALAEPIRQRGGRMSPEAIEHAVEAAGGYPFMVQLVGFHSWEAAAEPDTAVTVSDAVEGAQVAQQHIGQLVIAPLWRDQPDSARRFLIAMAHDDSESQLADIARRMDVTSGYVSVYRARLVKSGLVAATDKRSVTFALPGTRRWIRDLDVFAHVSETLHLTDGRSVGFTIPHD